MRRAPHACPASLWGEQLAPRSARRSRGPDGCAWSFEAADLPQLTLTLAKREPGLWGYVLLEDLEANQEEPPERDGPLDGSDEPTASSLQRPGVDWG